MNHKHKALKKRFSDAFDAFFGSEYDEVYSFPLSTAYICANCNNIFNVSFRNTCPNCTSKSYQHIESFFSSDNQDYQLLVNPTRKSQEERNERQHQNDRSVRETSFLYKRGGD